MNKSAGFSLIEVVITLAIVSTALAGIIQFMGQSAFTSRDLHLRLFAMVSANNQLAHIQLTKATPEISTNIRPCPQIQYEFICEQKISETSQTNIRKIEIEVYEFENNNRKGPRLAHLSHLIAQ